MSYELPLKLEDARTLLKEVVGEKPDFVYSSPEDKPDDPDADYSMCYYLHDDEPGCVVGHVLTRAGVPAGELAKRETSGITSFPAIDDPYGWRKLTTQAAGRYLQCAQRSQDARLTWQEALDDAEQNLYAVRRDYGDE